MYPTQAPDSHTWLAAMQKRPFEDQRWVKVEQILSGVHAAQYFVNGFLHSSTNVHMNTFRSRAVDVN